VVSPTAKGFLFQLNSGRNEGYGQQIRGGMSELAILSTLWWGVTNGQFHPDTFIFPTTKSQDASQPSQVWRTGYDLLLGTEGELMPLQVKSSRYDVPYHPDIFKIRPLQLINYGARTAARHLLEAFVDNDVKSLTHANAAARRIFAL
jgi:hypothetical protein